MARTVLRWDGEHLPDELKELPPGEYELRRVEPVDEADEPGVVEGLRELDRAEGIPLSRVLEELRAR